MDNEVVSFHEVGELYEVILVPEERRLLHGVRAKSRDMFRVGEIAEAAYQRAQAKGIPGWVAFHAVGEEAGIGVRRVMKLRQISERFPKKIQDKFPTMPFAYFEEAFVFPPGDDIQMLEFTHHLVGEEQRWPGAERIANDYRRVALGKHTGSGGGALPPPPTATVRTQRSSYTIPEPAPLQAEGYVKASKLRALVNKWRKTRPPWGQCVDDIEELLK
jgi:hypothetical protein